MASLARTARSSPSRGDSTPVMTCDGKVFLIELYGQLDLACVPELEACVRQAEGTPASEIVVDLSGVTMVDSAGITALLRAVRRSQMSGSRLRFLRGSGQVERVIRLCRLDERLPFLD